MLNLNELKTRLEDLPKKKQEHERAASFTNATSEISNCRARLTITFNYMSFASQVSSTPENYDKEVLERINSAITIAKALKDTISSAPQSIDSKSTKDSIIKIKDYTNNAEAKCSALWNSEIDSIVSRWDNLARVVENKLGTTGDKKMKRSIEHIKSHSLPKNSTEVNNLKTAISDLKESIATLGLDGPFGRFLESAVGGGASAEDLLKDEIRSKLDQYHLWNSFRVKI